LTLTGTGRDHAEATGTLRDTWAKIEKAMKSA
jgi:hypothetical protein